MPTQDDINNAISIILSFLGVDQSPIQIRPTPSPRITGYANRGGQIVPVYGEIPIRTSSPTPSSSPTAASQQVPQPFQFNFTPHIDENTKRTIYAPTDDTALFQQYFPKEATSAAVAAFNESMYNPMAQNQNTANPQSPYYQTWDRGYFQLNDKTVRELFQKYPNTIRKMGINSYEDWLNNKWKDKTANFAMAKLVRDKLEDRSNKPAWSSWHGWQDQGFKDVGNPNINYQAGQ